MPADRWTFWQSAFCCAELEAAGQTLDMPEGGYQGDYIRDIAVGTVIPAARGR